MSVLNQMSKDIEMIAKKMAHKLVEREELCQEMVSHLLTLEQGHPKKYYRKACRARAINYMNRKMFDAPLDNDGKAILVRRIYYVGGLSDLNRVVYGDAA